MPDAVVITVGAANANSFQDIAGATATLDNRFNAGAWAAEADADQLIRALLSAAVEMTLMPWLGQRTDDVQALSWPRENVENPDLPDSDDGLSTLTYYDNDIVPQRVKDAQSELAFEILRAGTTDILVRDTLLDVKRKKVDVLETEYFGSSERARGLQKYPRILTLLSPLLDVSGVGMEVVRV